MTSILQFRVTGGCVRYRSKGWTRLGVLCFSPVFHVSVKFARHQAYPRKLSRATSFEHTRHWQKNKKPKPRALLAYYHHIYKGSFLNTLFTGVVALPIFNSFFQIYCTPLSGVTVLLIFDSFFHSCCTPLSGVNLLLMFDSFSRIIVLVNLLPPLLCPNRVNLLCEVMQRCSIRIFWPGPWKGYLQPSRARSYQRNRVR